MKCSLAWRASSYLLWMLSLGQLFANGQAPASSESSSKPHKSVTHAHAASPDAGSLTEGVYRNSFFGVVYKVPLGWVDRTGEMREGSEAGKSLVLLAVFERPPEAAAETVNSAVIIAAENVSSYPGLKTATDYFGPLTEVTTSKGFNVVTGPYELRVGARQLVRGDFSRDLGKVKMLQSTLVALQRGYVVSFTFLGGDEDEIESLVEGLSFTGGKSGSSGQSPAAH